MVWPAHKNPAYEPKTEPQILGHLIEECGEVLAAAGKSLRWGLDGVNPELPVPERETNREWLLREMEDLELALVNAKIFLSSTGPNTTKVFRMDLQESDCGHVSVIGPTRMSESE